MNMWKAPESYMSNESSENFQNLEGLKKDICTESIQAHKPWEA